MNDNYHQERSRLIQKHKEEVRIIEKEIKSKKGILREQSQKKLEQAQERHKSEILEFESKHGGDSKKNNKVSCEDRYIEDNQHKSNLTIFEEKQWNSLSKSELECECKLRGISSKGNKEDLVTRLLIFTADQKSKLNTLSDDKKKNDSDIFWKNIEPHVSKKVNDVETKNIITPEIKFSEAGGTGKKKNRSQNRKIDHRKNNSYCENSWAAFCARNDIPNKKSVELGIYEDSGSSDSVENNETKHEASSEKESKDEAEESNKMSEEHEKRNKRRAVMLKVLEKMFSNITINEKRDGIKLSDLDSKFAKLNVKNFRPELLGYKSTEDWISSQSGKTLTYDFKNKTIFPKDHRISDAGENKDGIYEVDHFSDTDNDIHYFM